MGELSELARFLADRDGVITSAQAHELGLTRAQIRSRVRRDEWRPTAKGLYRSTSHPMTERMIVRSAALAHNGVVDRVAAAWLHGLLDVLPTVITLAVGYAVKPGRWLLGETDAVRRVYADDDLAEVAGIAVTAIPITVLYTAIMVEDGFAWADRMLQKKVVTVPQLVVAYERCRGCPGAPAMPRLIEIVSGDSESIAERLFAQMLRDAGIDGWTQQFALGRWRLDFAWPDLAVNVEIQGLAFHRTPRQGMNDEAKSNALEAAKWRRLGFTWHQLTSEPEECIRQVVEILEQQMDLLR